MRWLLILTLSLVSPLAATAAPSCSQDSTSRAVRADGLAALAGANPVPQPVELIDAAGDELLIYAPVMRDRSQAQAIQRAVVQRGVRVVIISEPEAALEASSYLPSLKLAGAGVFLARVPNGMQGLILADNHVALTGIGIGRARLVYEPGLRLEQTRNIPALRAWFFRALEQSHALSLSQVIGR